jgi:short-subunit dehydrogenase
MFKQSVILITGASSGVGQATACLLSEKGYKVYGTSRNSINAESIPNVEMLDLDVRFDDSVTTCVNDVLSRAGQIDALINNAGHELAGASEEISLDEAKAQFELNFFGAIRMVKAVLPSMRKQKHGRIINVSSLSGLTPIPFLGIYSASKFALEGYSEALRHEVKPFNIHVSLIEPAFLKTPMMKNRQLVAAQIKDYDQWRERALNAIRNFENKAPGPEMVAETIFEVLGSDQPRLRYITGKQARSIMRLRRFLPESLYEQGVRGNFWLDKKQ